MSRGWKGKPLNRGRNREKITCTEASRILSKTGELRNKDIYLGSTGSFCEHVKINAIDFPLRKVASGWRVTKLMIINNNFMLKKADYAEKYI